MKTDKASNPKETVMEEDDFDVSTLPRAKKEEDSVEPEKTDEKADSAKGEDEPDQDNKTDDKTSDPEKKGDKTDQEDKADTDADENEEEDIFAEITPDDEKQGDTFDFGTVLKELEIEADEEVKDKESFVKATKKAIESAREQIDLSGYNDQAQSLIKHLNEKKGDLVSFFENPVITQMNRMLMLKPEDRFREVRYAELYEKHKNEDDAVEALEAEIEGMSKGEIKTKAEEIAEQAGKIRSDEIFKLIGQNEEKAKVAEKAEEQRILKEQQNIKSFIDKQNDFFGLGLTKAAKQTIIKDIDNGKFDDLVNKAPEASKFFAYMVGKYGGKIVEKYNNALKEANRTGYNIMQDKAFDALHKTKPGHDSSAGHKADSGGKKNFENLTSDVFGE